jgi:putative oxidoreductase
MEAARNKSVEQIFPREVIQEMARDQLPTNQPSSSNAIRYAAPLGRFCFSLIFILSSFGHFTRPYINMAGAHGVPIPEVLVPLFGLIALVGGLSVLFGYRARLGALLLVLFLVPVTLAMHAFWSVGDATLAQMQQAMFMKNLSMLGGALLILYFGAGPYSMDSRSRSSRTLQTTY